MAVMVVVVSKGGRYEGGSDGGTEVVVNGGRRDGGDSV